MKHHALTTLALTMVITCIPLECAALTDESAAPDLSAQSVQMQRQPAKSNPQYQGPKKSSVTRKNPTHHPAPSVFASPDGQVLIYEDEDQRIISLSKDPDPALFQNYHPRDEIKLKCAGLSERECIDTYYDRKYYYENLQH